MRIDEIHRLPPALTMTMRFASRGRLHPFCAQNKLSGWSLPAVPGNSHSEIDLPFAIALQPIGRSASATR